MERYTKDMRARCNRKTLANQSKDVLQTHTDQCLLRHCRCLTYIVLIRMNITSIHI